MNIKKRVAANFIQICAVLACENVNSLFIKIFDSSDQPHIFRFPATRVLQILSNCDITKIHLHVYLNQTRLCNMSMSCNIAKS